MEKFILLAKQRSGTGFFTSVLNNHPEVNCFPELLLWHSYQDTNNFYHFWREKIIESADNIIPSGKRNVLGEFFDFTFASKKDKNAIGVNIKYDQMYTVSSQISILAEKFNKVIHLVRKNVLKTSISNFLNNNKEKLGRKSHSSEKYDACKVTLPIHENLLTELADYKNNIIKHRKIFKNLYQDNYLEIFYEDFFDNKIDESNTIREEILQTVFNFLNISHQYNIQTKLMKINPDNLEDLIENYHETKLFLELNGWGYLFAESVGEPMTLERAQSDIEKVVIHLQDRRLEKAFNIIKTLYKQNPLDENIVRLFISILFQLNMTEQATQVFDIINKVYPNYAPVTEAYNFWMRHLNG